MQPYQEASEEIIRQSKEPGKALSAISKSAAGLAGGGAIINRVLPFLNQYISPDLAKKGLSKVDKRLSNFITQAEKQGHPVGEIMDFIKENVTDEPKKEKNQKKTKVNDDLIELYSPELSQFIEGFMDQGESPETAAALVKSNPKNFNQFKEIIKKLEDDTGQKFAEIVKEIYGKFFKGRENKQKIPSQMTMKSQSQQSEQQKPQQSGQGQAALMAALQKLQQIRGGG